MQKPSLLRRAVSGRAQGGPIRFRDKVIMWELVLLLLFNYGYMQVRIPPIGFGIPTGELLLVFYLCSFTVLGAIRHLSKQILIVPCLVWWFLGMVRALMGVPKYGVWAIRDATHVIESFYLLVGYVFFTHERSREVLLRHYPKVLAIIGVYSLTYPAREALQRISPKIPSPNGVPTAIFFWYMFTPGFVLVAAAAYLLLADRGAIGKLRATVVSGVLVAFTVAIYQTRTVYLQFAGIAVFLFVYSRRNVSRWFAAVLVLICGVAAIQVTGVQIRGRLDQPISFQFMADHVASIVGIESNSAEGAARGSEQRVDWWKDILHRWTATPTTFMFGLGYGFPLIDLITTDGVPVREPHNSVISIAARLGFLGLVAWLWLQALLLLRWRRALAYCNCLGFHRETIFLKVTMVFSIVVLIGGMTEPSFELTFLTIPYYFLWGLVLALEASTRKRYRAALHTAEAESAPFELLQPA